MTVEQKIDFMIAALQLAKDELKYAKLFEQKEKLHTLTYDDRLPSGTLIRENLKTVSRLSAITAKDVTLSPYCRDICRGEK